VPELPGCPAYSESEERALREIKTAIDLWLSTARNIGREIPKPHGSELLRNLLDEQSNFFVVLYKRSWFISPFTIRMSGETHASLDRSCGFPERSPATRKETSNSSAGCRNAC
jgi:hypothetical protein